MRRSLLQQYIEVLLISIVLAVFARTFLLQGFEIPSGSMERTLLSGDHLLVNKLIYAPMRFDLERRLLPQRKVERGDIVVFRFPEDPKRDLVKRCVAIGGDVVEIVDRELRVNGRKVDERYTEHNDEKVYPASQFLPESLRYRDNFGPLRVPDHELFCLGDNREDSNDSRFWGTVPERLVRGRALLIYWSEELVQEEGQAPRMRRRWQRSLRFVQ